MSQSERYRSIDKVYRLSLAINIVMLSLKLGVGFLTGSLVMVADGLDSSLDAVANIMAMVVTRIAGRPADKDHPYGHRRFETLAAMMIGGFLLLTASEIVKSSVGRLISGEVPDIGPANFAVMMLALGVNLALFFYQRREGKRLRSEVLVASSEDKRSDIMVSITILIMLVAIALAWPWLDAVAALVVVALIARNALRIVGRSANILADRAALDAEAVRAVVEAVAGVRQVVRVRSRGPEDDVHLDLDVQIAGPTTAEHSAAIADEARERLRARFDGLTEIQVNFLPARDAPPDYALIARAEADALGLGVHEVVTISNASGLTLDMHIEVPPEQTVAEAHAVVSQFETRLARALPEVRRIVTHIEPAHTVEECRRCDDGARNVAQQAIRMAEHLFPNNDWYDADIHMDGGGYALSMHCHVDGDMPLEAAHHLAESVETQVRAALPSIRRVTIHTEPLAHAVPGEPEPPKR